MHSCDVSLCVGSRGAWSEVHVGQRGSAVVMTIIISITVCCTNRWLGVRQDVCTQSPPSLCMAEQYLTVGLNCCDHQFFFFFYNKQSLLSPIRSES